MPEAESGKTRRPFPARSERFVDEIVKRNAHKEEPAPGFPGAGFSEGVVLSVCYGSVGSPGVMYAISHEVTSTYTWLRSLSGTMIVISM